MDAHISCFRRLALLPILLVLIVLLMPVPTAAHPADELLQHLQIDLAPNRIALTISVGGGVLSRQTLIDALDSDGNGVAAADEIADWTQDFVSHLAVSIDGRPLLLDPDKATTTMPDLHDFTLGLHPIEVALQLPVVAPDRVEQMLDVTNSYRPLKSTYTVDVSTTGGIGIVSQGWPSKDIRVSYGQGIGSPAAHSSRTAIALATTPLGARAAELFGRERTPQFFLILLATFAAVGALHAAQPGHGKALVAGYLVATQGTMRDALALASIVTFTHTAGVFVLGGVAIAASALFMPERVVPIMQVMSAILVIVLGLNLLRRALFGTTHGHSPAPAGHHHDHEPHHHHDHDHENLTDEEHAQLHLEEALAIRQHSSARNLLTLGVAGGIVPCPEALAILLLAIGLHQAWLGMLAIFAFSTGLAIVLVAFGALVSILQSRSSSMMRLIPGGSSGSAGKLAATLAALLPVASALVITTVGIVMLITQVTAR